MITNFDRVEEFMTTFGQEVKHSPEWPDDVTVDLREELIREEFQELRDAIQDQIKGLGSDEDTLVAVADALTDILVVTYGAGHAFGIDLDACFQEVHRSNMSKLGEDGKPIYREGDGKVLKGPNYSKPDLKQILFPENEQEQ